MRRWCDADVDSHFSNCRFISTFHFFFFFIIFSCTHRSHYYYIFGIRVLDFSGFCCVCFFSFCWWRRQSGSYVVLVDAAAVRHYYLFNYSIRLQLFHYESSCTLRTHCRMLSCFFSLLKFVCWAYINPTPEKSASNAYILIWKGACRSFCIFRWIKWIESINVLSYLTWSEQITWLQCFVVVFSPLFARLFLSINNRQPVPFR